MSMRVAPHRRILVAVVGLLCIGVPGSLPPTTNAGSPTPSLLRYAFRQGLAFTVRISVTNTEAIEQPGYPDRHYRETITGLEQGSIEQVYADGSALFRYRFADLLDAGRATPASLVFDTGGGPPAAVDSTLYTITQAVSADGRAETAAQQCSPYTAVDQFEPFALTPLPPIPYADHPAAVGNSWAAVLPPDNGVVSQARVRMTGRAGSSGSFQESATTPIHIEDPKVLGRIIGTTVLAESVRQDLTTGTPAAWHLRVTTQVARTDVPLTPGKPVTLRLQSSQVISATAVPNALFHAARRPPDPAMEATPTPVPTADPHALPPAVAALAALNLGSAEVPACYHVTQSIAVTPSVLTDWFPPGDSSFLDGHLVQFRWYPQIGQSVIVALVLRFADAAHAHAFLRGRSMPPQPPDVARNLHGIQVGDERRFGYGEPYGSFDLALRDIQYNELYGQFILMFRRGPYVGGLILLGDFAPIDLGRYGRRMDQRLQHALATGVAP